jgi:hypothetical protein
MTSWKRTSRDSVRILFTQNQHVAIVTGKKHRRCAEIELVEVTQNVLAIQCRCQHIGAHETYAGQDNYCVVQPVFAGTMRPYISLLHRDGTDMVKVETLPVPVPSSSAHPGLLKTAIGFSQNYSLDEAFNDALQKLGLFPSPYSKGETSVVDVVSMGAVYGGFSGYNRMFVRVEQSSILQVFDGPSRSAPPAHKPIRGKSRGV